MGLDKVLVINSQILTQVVGTGKVLRYSPPSSFNAVESEWSREVLDEFAAMVPRSCG